MNREVSSCNIKLEIKTEQLEDFETTPEELHHSVDIKEELSIFKTETDEDPEAQLCRQVQCGNCDLKFTSTSELDNHHAKIHSDTKYKSARRRNLVRYNDTDTGAKIFVCEICDYKTLVKFTFKRHVRTHTGNKPFACNSCDYKSYRKESLRKHLRMHTFEKVFVCKTCDYRTSVKEILKIHLGTHTSEKPFTCEICENKYTQKIYLQVHLKTHANL